MIESREDLDAIKQSCQSMVTRSSGLSAGAAIIPIPGVDLGSDVAILMRLIPQINEKFGLSPEQIESLDTESKLFVMTAISNTGSKLAGKYITKKLIVTVLNKMGIKVAAKGVTKFVPLIGSAVAGSISFTAMKVMGNRHIEDCYQIALAALEEERLAHEIVIEPETESEPGPVKNSPQSQ
ncbi:hypothetical protein L0636_11715 [Halomonas janggokensis]|uniref:DUF697 domain-containing protein n=2 Tax=Halomonadaceae TaxID=28256 RepID=A0ABT4IQS0_9GAMM|nr:hypothetical protein [Halomonas janggokensis]MCZ0926022.1 hypothetical protein [Halomonas janggokensis]MCZ0931089.1 hypothetical protein [Halomonas janggokensis]